MNGVEIIADDSQTIGTVTYLDEIVTLPDQILLFHYTNVEALCNGIIVSSPEKDKEICLWASNCEYMNDSSEIDIGLKLVTEKLFKVNKRPFSSKYKREAKDKYFSISFSELNDSLPIWGIYGKNGSGIVLGFDNKDIKEDDFKPLLYRCIYIDNVNLGEIGAKGKKKDCVENSDEISSDDKILIFENTLKKLLTSVFMIVLDYLYLIFLTKHQAYSYEKEIRLIEIIEDKSLVKYRHSKNLIIPYVEKYFPKKSLKEIWIGPTNDIKRSTKSIKTFLKAKGFGHVKVYSSKLPYRG